VRACVRVCVCVCVCVRECECVCVCVHVQRAIQTICTMHVIHRLCKVLPVCSVCAMSFVNTVCHVQVVFRAWYCACSFKVVQRVLCAMCSVYCKPYA